MSRETEGTIRALVVDDEPLAREGLLLLLAEDPEVDVVGECGDGEAAAEAIAALRPDLVFMDIQMPEANGFEAFAEFGDDRPLVIFVTAYDEYAIRAFDVRAIDYLLKPFDDERFEDALARAKTRLRERRDSDLTRRIARLMAEREEAGERGRAGSPVRAESRRAGERDVGAARRRGVEEDARSDDDGYLERLVVKRAGRVLFVDIDDVEWVEAADYYVRLHTGADTHLLRTTMKRMERVLDPDVFFRIHRSFIVRLDHIRELRPESSGEYSVILRDGRELSLSRSRRKLLEERLGQRL